jgi:glutamate--cysteine ligase
MGRPALRRHALGAAWDEVKHWTLDERQTLRDSVPRLGLDAPVPGGGTLQQLGERVLAIAESGLNARAAHNAAGDNESGFLDTLRDILARRASPAQQMLDRYHGTWSGNVARVYDEMSF